MKKTILLTSIAALTALSSCTMDEIKEVNQGTPIGFRTSVATRGLEAQSTTLSEFYTTALEENSTTAYFTNLPFSKSGNDYFSSDPTYYWPGQGRKLSFHAYAGVDPSKVTIANTKSKDENENDIFTTTRSITEFTVKADIVEQTDLIYASTDYMEEATEVPLNFQHKLSKIGISATSSANYTYNIAGVKIAGVQGTGSISDLSGTTWTVSGNPMDYTYDGSANIITINSNNQAEYLLGEQKDFENNSRENYAFMIPQTITSWNPTNPSNGGAYIAVNIQINTPEGVRVYPTTGDYGWVAIPIPAGTTWQAGYAYNYTLDFSEGAGYVAPGVDVSNVGTPVLGNAKIKMSMSLSGMEEPANLNNANPNLAKMIGIWNVKTFTQVDKYYTYETEGEGDAAVETKVYTGTEVTDYNLSVANGDLDQISGIIDQFSYIEIIDGTRLVIQTNPSGVKFRLNNDNYILIDCYVVDKEDLGSTDEHDYDPRPQIIEITPVSVDENGEVVPGSATIECLYEDNSSDGNLYETVQTITYEITPVTK